MSAQFQLVTHSEELINLKDINYLDGYINLSNYNFFEKILIESTMSFEEISEGCRSNKNNLSKNECLLIEKYLISNSIFNKEQVKELMLEEWERINSIYHEDINIFISNVYHLMNKFDKVNETLNNQPYNVDL
jgi:hypothetical protein